MIIDRNPIIGFHDFATGLQAAARGTVLVGPAQGWPSGGSGGIATGWVVTDDLVMLPGYAALEIQRSLGGDARFWVSWTSEENWFPAQAVLVPPDDKEGTKPALLRLERPFEGRSLRLSLETVVPGEPVLLTQFPGGRPQLCVSAGLVADVADGWLSYDASTEVGSGGAPVFALSSLAVVAMHTRRSREAFAPRFVNQGRTMPSLLASLEGAPAWPEIARRHGLANTQAALRGLNGPVPEPAPVPSDALDAALLPYALRWDFDPNDAPPPVRARLEDLADDPDASRWTLSAAARRLLIRAAPSLDALRAAGAANPSDEHPGQAAVAWALNALDETAPGLGAEASLGGVKSAALPYLLQVVRWFEGAAPSLPSPEHVNLALERRRVRDRLADIAGAFRGREAELEQLRVWYDDGSAPLVVSGIGGMGKSALVARFAAGLPADTVLLWLDFDRADLAPDDAVSVLASLAVQARPQLDGFAAPAVNEADIPASTEAFAAALAGRLPAGAKPLLVLDGFEVAQHRAAHAEIWGVLDRVLQHVPALRVLVSGRAPVPGLRLRERDAAALHLQGLAPADAQQWLQDRMRERGLADANALDRLAHASRGVPLILRLIARLLEAGEPLEYLVERLPEALVEGYLYQRILHRVIDPALAPLAADALVLRMLSPAVLAGVLHDRIPPGSSAEDAHARLARELGLVEDIGAGTDALRLRPEVRTATLQLLEAHNGARVREVDRRAATWYAGRDVSAAPVAAECLYHRLRIGDVAGADALWRPDLAPLLLHAPDELPAGARDARQWLQSKLRGDTPEEDLALWEADATARVADALRRNHHRAVPGILGERAGRSPGSPLVLYDAWALHKDNKDAEARALIEGALIKEAPAAAGLLARDRAVLAAMLAAKDGDRPSADKWLQAVDDERLWHAGPLGRLMALAVPTGRMWLTIDLRAELKLLRLLNGRESGRLLDALREMLHPGDAVLPTLSEQLQGFTGLESASAPLHIPVEAGQAGEFRLRVEAERDALPLARAVAMAMKERPDAWTVEALGFKADDLLSDALAPEAEGVRTGLRLCLLARRRWGIATRDLFLRDLIRCALERPSVDEQLADGLCSALAVIDGQNLQYSGWHSLDVRSQLFHRSRKASQIEALAEGGSLNRRLALGLMDFFENASEADLLAREFERLPHRRVAFFVHALTSNPLDALCNAVVGTRSEARLP